MNEDQSHPDLSTLAPDHAASAAKALLGAVPLAGSLLAEIASSIIPNQRIDRIADFAEQLESRLSDVERGGIRSSLTDEELEQLRHKLGELSKNAADGFKQMAADLAAAGVRNEEQYRALLAALTSYFAAPQPAPLPVCFIPASDAFSALIARNFLFEFRGATSDYVELLSNDLRRLFFSLFNDHLRSGKTNRLVVSGHEGAGKTFSLLLLALQLMREGHAVHYCHDIRSSSLTPEAIRSIAIRDNDTAILIIDNCQHDLIKTEQVTSAISRAGVYEGKPLFVFLTRPLDDDTRLDTFGADTPTLTMRERFVDFERLVRLRFDQFGQPERAAEFLECVATIRTQEFAFKYRNMAFWNEVLRSILAGSSASLSEEDIFKRAHAFLQRKETHLINSREAISRLLPLFCLGVAVQSDYAAELLGEGAEPALRTLASEGLVSIVAQDWESEEYVAASTLVVAPRLHPTKARVLATVYRKYYGIQADPVEALAAYAERFPHCLYHILGRYSGPDESRVLFSNARIQGITRRYFLERHLGKKLDRVIRRFGDLDDSLLDVLLDEDVLQAFAKQVNGDRAYIVSKMYIFRALERVSPKKAYQLFSLVTPDAVSKTFLADETEGGITSLSKWMEVFKNVYYYAPTAEAKEAVRQFVRTVIDECRPEFMRRFEKMDRYFSNLHWLLKRLHGLKLANYFLEGVDPATLVALIRTKDTNVVELCRYVLYDARYTSWIAADGSRCRYADVLRDTLSYEDLKRVFDNRRSDLYDLAINATHDFVAQALVKYADDPGFVHKAAQESPYLRNVSMRLMSTNWFLGEEQKAKLINTIMKAGSGVATD